MTLEERCQKIEEYFRSEFGVELYWEKGRGCEEDEECACIECPGKHLHTKPNKPTDCVIYANEACAINCLHQSCKEDCDAVQGSVKAFVGEEPSSSPVERKKRKATSELYLKANEVYQSITSALPQVYVNHDYKRQGICLKWSPLEQWERFFSLFAPEDVLWIGEVQDSGFRGVGHFRTAADWIKVRKYKRFTTSSVFDSIGRTVRAQDGVIKTPYRVLEFDHLDLNPDINKRMSLALIWHLREVWGVPLRAQIDSGHQSIHSWCDNDPSIFDEAFILALHRLGADPNVLKRPSQPVRFPGVPRDSLNQQMLIWISPK